MWEYDEHGGSHVGHQFGTEGQGWGGQWRGEYVGGVFEEVHGLICTFQGHADHILTARFTKPEKLGVKEYSCSKCTKAHEAVKRLSIRKLPPVLSFQFKVCSLVW